MSKKECFSCGEQYEIKDMVKKQGKKYICNKCYNEGQDFKRDNEKEQMISNANKKEKVYAK